MSWKRTFFAGLIFLFCLGIFLVDQVIVKKQKVSKEISESLTHIPFEKIQSFILKNQYGTFELRKLNEKNWEIFSPRQLIADSDTIRTMLTNLNGGKKHNVLETRDFSQYGLINPKITVTIKGEGIEGIKEESLSIGDDASYAGKVFAKVVGENKVFTVNEHIKNNLDKSLNDIRDKTLLHISEDNVESFEIENKNGKIVIQQLIKREKEGKEEKKQEGIIYKAKNWEITEPIKENADSQVVENLLREIKIKKIISFIEKDLKPLDEYGLDQPEITFTAKVKSTRDEGITSPIQTLLIGEKTEGEARRYAMRSGESFIFEVPEDLTEKINQKPGDFRDRRIFTINQSDIVRISVEAGKAKTVLVKADDGKWTFQDDKNRKVDQPKVWDYLGELLKVKIKEFVDDKPKDLTQFGLERPLIQIEVQNKEGKKEGLLTGRKNEEKQFTYVKKASSKSILGIDWTLIHKLLVTEEDFIDKTLLTFDENDIARIEIDFKGKTYLLEKEENTYTCKPPEGEKYKLEYMKTSPFIVALTGLKYRVTIKGTFISNVDDGLKNPEWAFRIKNKKGEKIADLKIGNEVEENVFAECNGKTYKVEKTKLETLLTSAKEIIQKTEKNLKM